MEKKKIKLGRQEQAKAEQDPKQRQQQIQGQCVCATYDHPFYNPAFPRQGYSIPPQKSCA